MQAYLVSSTRLSDSRTAMKDLIDLYDLKINWVCSYRIAAMSPRGQQPEGTSTAAHSPKLIHSG